MTPLHWAVERGNISCAETLLKFGADVNSVSKFGKCPLELASERGRSDIFELLQNAEEIRAKAVVDMTDSTVSDPITMAATQSIANEIGHVTNYEEILPHSATSETASQGTIMQLNMYKTTSCRIKEFGPQGHLLALEGLLFQPSFHADTRFCVFFFEIEVNFYHDYLSEEAMKLLAAHGITLLPEDTGGSQLMDAAINSGQTLTLTEAGKLALSSSNPSSPVVTTTVPSFSQIKLAAPSAPKTSNVSPNIVKVSTHAPLQTTKSIVINTSQQDYQPQLKKTPRVIRVTPEQFAAIKAGKGPKFSGLQASKPSNVITVNKSKPTSRLVAPSISNLKSVSGVRVENKSLQSAQGKTIKIVRVSPNSKASPNPTIQLMPKPPESTMAMGADQALIQKKLKEIEDASEALQRRKEELLRQLAT